MTPKRAAWAASVCTVGIGAQWILAAFTLGTILFDSDRGNLSHRIIFFLCVIAAVAVPLVAWRVLYGLLYGAFRQRGKG